MYMMTRISNQWKLNQIIQLLIIMLMITDIINSGYDSDDNLLSNFDDDDGLILDRDEHEKDDDDNSKQDEDGSDDVSCKSNQQFPFYITRQPNILKQLFVVVSFITSIHPENM